MNRPLLKTIGLWLVLMTMGCAGAPVVVVDPPPILPPIQPQNVVALVPISTLAEPFPLASIFHEDLKAALRRTQSFQVQDFSGPWPSSCSRPTVGAPLDLRLIASDLQKVCPSTYSILYEITHLTTVRPMKMGVRVLVIRTADGMAVVDYDGIWDAPIGPPLPPRRRGFRFWAKCEPIVAYDPLAEVSPRLLGQTASRDIAMMLTNASASNWSDANCVAPGTPISFPASSPVVPEPSPDIPQPTLPPVPPVAPPDAATPQDLSPSEPQPPTSIPPDTFEPITNSPESPSIR